MPVIQFGSPTASGNINVDLSPEMNNVSDDQTQINRSFRGSGGSGTETAYTVTATKTLYMTKLRIETGAMICAVGDNISAVLGPGAGGEQVQLISSFAGVAEFEFNPPLPFSTEVTIVNSSAANTNITFSGWEE